MKLTLVILGKISLLLPRIAILAVFLVQWSVTQAASQKEGSVKFDHERGFYEKPFDLKLRHESKEARIFYTLNGTLPTPANGRPYEAPIRIAGITTIRAAAYVDGKISGIDKSRTFLFPKQVFVQSSDTLPPPDWPFSWGNNRVDFGMDPRIINDPAYAPELDRALKSIPSISMVMDLDDLFDEKKGIYANAMVRGKEMERVCSLEYIVPGTQDGFQINAGVRIRGGFSRMPNNAKHSFRFFFRKKYGEANLKYPLFGKEAAQEFDGFDLRTSQNYSWSMGGDERAVFIRDILCRDLQLAMGQPSPRGRFVHLFINGQYWGLFNTCERPEAEFGATYFGGKKEDYDTLKARGGAGAGFMPGGGGEMPFATDGDKEAWKQLWQGAKAGLAKNEPYLKLMGLTPEGKRDPNIPVLLDPVNLIDYMLVIFYGGNIDSPITKFSGNSAANNWFSLRSKKAGHGFKSFIWDAEHTFLDVHEDRTGPFSAGEQFEQSNPQWVFQQCLENSEFRMLLADRIERHTSQDGALSKERVLASFHSRIKEIESAVILESARWGDSRGGFRFGGDDEQGPRTRNRHWRAEVERIESEFINKRTGILREQLWGLGVLPDLGAPIIRKNGDQVVLESKQGEICYLESGEDPRMMGGARRPDAKVVTGSIALSASTRLKARVWLKGEWSALKEWPN